MVLPDLQYAEHYLLSAKELLKNQNLLFFALLGFYILSKLYPKLFAKLLVNPLFAPFAIVVHWFRRSEHRRKEERARNWPTQAAKIDVVTVPKRILTGHDKNNHLLESSATLSYFYHRPDLQMGEYVRKFSSREVALRWVEQYKGRSVAVHVNPDDTSESILLDDDLNGLDVLTETELEARMPAAATVKETAAEGKEPKIIPRWILVACGFAELICLAGLGVSGVLLGISVMRHGMTLSPWMIWSGTTLMGILFFFFVFVRSRYKVDWKRWCPGWLSWTSGLSSTFSGLLPFISHVHRWLPPIVHQWAHILQPYFPGIFGCCGFLLLTSFYTAVIRSQEQPWLEVAEELAGERS
jgi:hypothetical protein